MLYIQLMKYWFVYEILLCNKIPIHTNFQSEIEFLITFSDCKCGDSIIITIILMIHPFQFQYTQTVMFEEHCFLYRFFYMYPAFAGFRLRMFIGMALAECVCQMSGLGAYPVCCQSVPGLGPRDYKMIEKLYDFVILFWDIYIQQATFLLANDLHDYIYTPYYYPVSQLTRRDHICISRILISFCMIILGHQKIISAKE